ncbi:hypothetical protein D3C85_1945990 [compost metagenome]
MEPAHRLHHLAMTKHQCAVVQGAKAFQSSSSTINEGREGLSSWAIDIVRIS